jgi:hypothetical protein
MGVKTRGSKRDSSQKTRWKTVLRFAQSDGLKKDSLLRSE